MLLEIGSGGPEGSGWDRLPATGGQTLKRLEEVKYRLYAEHDVKVRKSDIIEMALVEGLADTERLAQALRNR